MIVKTPRPVSSQSSQKRPPLMMWCDPKAALDDIGPILARLETGYALSPMKSLEMIEASAAMQADTTILLLYRAPADWIYEQLENGETPQEALALWMEEARQICDLLRRHRSRILLQDLQLAQRDPEAFFGTFRLPPTEMVPEAASGEGEAGGKEPTQDPILRLLATQCLTRSTEAGLLAGELEAATQTGGFDPADSLKQLDQLYQDILLRRQPGGEDTDDTPSPEDAVFKRHTAQIAELQSLLSQKSQQIEGLQRALERQESESEKLGNQNEQQGHRFTQQQTYIADLEKLLSEQKAHVSEQQAHIRHQSELLAQQQKLHDGLQSNLQERSAALSKLQETLANKDQRTAALRQQMQRQLEELRLLHQDTGEKQQEIGDLTAQVDRIMNSHSMRITAPLRALRRLVSRG